MICSKCLCVVHDEAVICPYCGCATENAAGQQLLEDKTNKGLAFLSFVLSALIPQGVIFGFILWATKTDLQPKSAKAYGLCAVIPWLLRWIVPKVVNFIIKAVVAIVLAVVIIAIIVLSVLVLTGVISIPGLAIPAMA